jgi:hypothetical protein
MGVMSSFRVFVLASFVSAALAQSAAAIVIHNEGVNGDLSSTQGSPTLLALAFGTNTIIGSTIAGDRDFFTITVPDGTSFSQMILASFTSADDLAFVAIEEGATITSLVSAAALLGYMHPSAAFVGTDILDNIAAGAGALGFTPPLPSGTYAMWMQQTQAQLVSYQFDLILIPEPSIAVLLALGLGALAAIPRARA